MERITQLGYSPKNIPIPNKTSYLKDLIHRTEDLIVRMRWKAFFFEKNEKSKSKNKTSNHQCLNDNDDETDSYQKETFGFRTENIPPKNKHLINFESDLWALIEKISFKNENLNNFQCKLRKDVKSINKSNKLFIPADKTNNYYEISTHKYNQLLNNNITKSYKKVNQTKVDKINLEAKQITDDLKISDRVEKLKPNQAFITLKDHKHDFNTNPQCRLINPTHSEIGIISKQILEKANSKIRNTTKLQQWRNSQEVINWFQNINKKRNMAFLQFDIVEFYPSISEELFDKSLKFAQEYTVINKQELNILNHARKSILFTNEGAWTKKKGLFDVTMGAFDGAEVCELVGLFILNQINNNKTLQCLNIGLYRDDGLAIYKKCSGKNTDTVIKNLHRIFKQNDLKITTEPNCNEVNYLDITMKLNENEFMPYRKPNDEPTYINKYSNHPPHIIKELPSMINSRLSTLSCNKDHFDKAKPTYEAALNRSGYKIKMKFDKPSTDLNINNSKNIKDTKDKAKRKRSIIWYNPPYNQSITTNLGREFLKLIEAHFTSKNKLHKIFNKSKIKLSYSCTKNMGQIIKSHNRKLTSKEYKSTTDTTKCNCRVNSKCPLNGKCLTKSVVYMASISSDSKTYNYIGSTEGEFKTRYNNHLSDFKNEHRKTSTQLSKLIWDLKENNKEFKIQWKIKRKCNTYNGQTRKCDVCLSEKLEILKNKNESLINNRDELTAKCRHQNKFKLKSLMNDTKQKRKQQRKNR